MPKLHLQKLPLTPASAEAVDWVTQKLEWQATVRAWMPEGYERYVRILHPAYRIVQEEGRSVDQVAIPWSAICEWSGKPLHFQSRIQDISINEDGLDWSESGEGGYAPLQGQLDEVPLASLLVHLVTDINVQNEIWMLTWTGFGGPPDTLGLPVRVTWSLSRLGREYVLRKGVISSSDNREDPRLATAPTFWWPDDRSWFVSSDIDASSTYVGGSKELIEQILNDSDLESFPAELNDPYDGLFMSKIPFNPIKGRVSRGNLLREKTYRLILGFRFRLRRKRSSSAFLYRKKRFMEWRIRP